MTKQKSFFLTPPSPLSSPREGNSKQANGSLKKRPSVIIIYIHRFLHHWKKVAPRHDADVLYSAQNKLHYVPYVLCFRSTFTLMSAQKTLDAGQNMACNLCAVNMVLCTTFHSHVGSFMLGHWAGAWNKASGHHSLLKGTAFSHLARHYSECGCELGLSHICHF